MEPFQRGPGKHKGVEILYFEDAQIEKVKGNDISFAGFGSLHVLYFKDYNRFVLLLNNWIYPLLRRLIISSSPVKDDPSSRTYVLPALNGFSFELKINKVANSKAFENFETILEHSSRFSVFGKEIPYRKLEASPDDKVLRRASINTTPKEIISETVKKVLHQVQNKTATLKTGTKYLTSTKKRIESKDIKNKNFKKDAHSRIKKGFFEANQKLLNEFLQRRKTNPNLTEAKSIEELKNTSDSQAPSLFISKEELEEFILRNRGIYGYLHQPEEVEVRRGLMTNLRDGARDIRNRVRNALNRDKNVPSTEHVETLPLPDVSHYSG